VSDQPPTDGTDAEAFRYWINLFTADTWAMSQQGPDTAAWFATRNRKLTRELQQGDRIVCFVARVGFPAVLRATDRPRQINDGPYGDAFSIKVPAEPIIRLDLEEALPIDRLRDSLQQMPPWLVQGSGNEWPKDVGDTLVEVLRGWAASPERRELTTRQLDYRPRSGLASSLGQVTVPDDIEDQEVADTPVTSTVARPTPDGHVVESDVSDHVRVQARLLRIGRLLGETPWVTPDDQSKVNEHGIRLSDLQGVTTELPPQFDEATNRTIRHIDIMWLHRNRVDAAFEVEATTSIYSGLLRMADLLALQPNINIPLFLVVPDDRLDQALRELGRPVFRAMVQPLPESCRVITFSRLADLEELVKAAGGHLTTGVLREFSVSAET
jgi:hypothetical protein